MTLPRFEFLSPFFNTSSERLLKPKLAQNIVVCPLLGIPLTAHCLKDSPVLWFVMITERHARHSLHYSWGLFFSSFWRVVPRTMRAEPFIMQITTHVYLCEGHVSLCANILLSQHQDLNCFRLGFSVMASIIPFVRQI